MSNESIKKPRMKKSNDSAHDDFSNLPAIRRDAHRHVRTLSPMGMRVLVRIRERSDMTEGGLYLPESAKDSTAESLVAEVLEVASAHDTEQDEATNISGVPRGATVLIPKRAGTKVPWDEYLRIVDTKDILAIVDEIALS
jgi:chaperonin GroES